MKDNPEIISAATAVIGSIAKAIKIRLNWRKTVAAAILSGVIGYVIPGLILYFLPDAPKQMIIAVSVLVGFLMHGLIDVIEDSLQDRVKNMIAGKNNDNEQNKEQEIEEENGQAH